MIPTVDNVNNQLSSIFKLLQDDKDLKKNVNFRLEPKQRRQGARVSADDFELDDDTLDLLDHEDRPLWVAEPKYFVWFSFTPDVITSHPVAQTAWHCLTLNGTGAQAAIIRRCHYVALDYLQKKFRLSARDIAALLVQRMPRLTMDQLEEQLELILRRGSRYAAWEKDFGEGAVAVMGLTMTNKL